MLSNILFEDKKDQNNLDNNQLILNYQSFQNNNEQNNISKGNKIIENDNNTKLKNLQYQIDHPPPNNNKSKDINSNNCKKNDKHKKQKKINLNLFVL